MTTPLVVAHRGASHAEPEHTREAYELAVVEGADAFECDVRLTSDGHLVLIHDARIDRTSTGRGSVSRLSLSELEEHRFPHRHRGVDPQAYRIMTLTDLIAIADAGEPPMGLSIETKHPTVDSHRLEDAVIDILERAGRSGLNAGTRIMSFSRTALRRARARSAELPLVYLFDAPPSRYERGSLPAEVSIAGPSVAYLRDDRGYVARVHEHGHQVHVWTVDEPAEVELCVELGVDAIITNRPGAVNRLLGRAP